MKEAISLAKELEIPVSERWLLEGARGSVPATGET